MDLFQTDRRLAALAATLFLVVDAGAQAQTAPAASAVITEMDLSKAFDTRSAWRFVVRQSAEVAQGGADDAEPGEIRLCLQRDNREDCAGELPSMVSRDPDDRSRAHYLNDAELVYPHGRAAAPLLLLQTASVHSMNGNQGIYTQLYAYRAATDAFVQVYAHVTGHNNNQEVRFIASGPLAGAVISAEPTQDAPFGYWITVSRLKSADAYTQTLRYRSATRYNDGNPLNVIDSEMPNMQARLGLWRPGMPLPLPGGPCPKPRLTHMELWCS